MTSGCVGGEGEDEKMNWMHLQSLTLMVLCLSVAQPWRHKAANTCVCPVFSLNLLLLMSKKVKYFRKNRQHFITLCRFNLFVELHLTVLIAVVLFFWYVCFYNCILFVFLQLFQLAKRLSVMKQSPWMVSRFKIKIPVKISSDNWCRPNE